MDKIYVAMAWTGHEDKPIAASRKKKGLKCFAVSVANENHKRVGVVNRELVYIEYKTSDIDIIELPCPPAR